MMRKRQNQSIDQLAFWGQFIEDKKAQKPVWK